MRALVIDDSRATRAILGGMMRDLGFEVGEAVNGGDALARLKEQDPPDVALLDWNMPEMNGYDFLCKVRADREFDEMRIVMVTIETELSQMIRALEAGANEYVMKPFTRDIIRDKLQLLGILPLQHQLS